MTKDSPRDAASADSLCISGHVVEIERMYFETCIKRHIDLLRPACGFIIVSLVDKDVS